MQDIIQVQSSTSTPRTPLWKVNELSNLRFWIFTIFGVGLIVRIGVVLATLHVGLYGGGEPYNIAISLADNGTYADAFGRGVGPTAHTAPLLPLILAAIIRLFGVGLTGYLIRVAFTSIAAAMAFALLPALAVRSQLGLPAGVIAGLIGAIAPINFWAQTAGIFDAPYTMLGLIGLCVALSGYWVNGYFPARGAVALGLLSGFICLLNPTIVEVLVGWYVFGMLRFKNDRRELSIFTATAAAVVVICLSPWALRNARALGSAIWTRSNFGLELQVSNNDRATADLEQNVREPDFPHPFTDSNERNKIRLMGEVAYHETKKKDALSWIGSHPARFAQLALRRIFLFWFPSMARLLQSIAEDLITILAFAGLLSLFRNNHPSAWMFLAVLVCYPAVYLIIQVSPRYRLPIEPILLLLGCIFCINLRNTLKGSGIRNDTSTACSL